jgi:hypothetical protein
MGEPEGQLAYGLAQAGSGRELATCSGRGWFVKDGLLHPSREGKDVRMAAAHQAVGRAGSSAFALGATGGDKRATTQT